VLISTCFVVTYTKAARAADYQIVQIASGLSQPSCVAPGGVTQTPGNPASLSPVDLGSQTLSSPNEIAFAMLNERLVTKDICIGLRGELKAASFFSLDCSELTHHYT
jgi:hypothetical protein